MIVRSEVAADLGGATLGRVFSCHLEVGSTNDVALRAGQDGVPHGTVILAERQTAGRGRLGRDWYSPPGTGLWFSVVLRYALEPAQVWMLTLGAGLAVANAVRDTAGIPVDLKWPNDVRTGGRKLAGVLTEACSDRDRLQLAVVGIGLNVNQDPREFPGDLVDTATSLNIETGSVHRRSAVLANVLRELDAVYSVLDPDHIRARWREASTMWGHPVRVTCGDTAVEGIAEDLSPEGALCLRTPDGEVTTVRSGDVGNAVESPRTREA